MAKYILIDKKLLLSDENFKFNIYIPSESKKQMNLFKEKENTITNEEKSSIKTDIEALYIDEVDKEKYDVAYKLFLLPQEESKIKKETIEEKSKAVYIKATKVIDNLFKNPENLANYKESKEVVHDLLITILDDDFTLKSLLSIASHDYYTHTHSLNVAVYALSLGKYLSLQKETLEELGEAALLHDLGKSKIDTKIINKDGKLTNIEFENMQNHSEQGYGLGLKVGISNVNILNGIMYHHEKMDGTGYPKGLKGKDIPYFARIIAICDIFDALVSKRTYKDAMSTFDALKLIKTKMNNHVDPSILNKMIQMFR